MSTSRAELAEDLMIFLDCPVDALIAPETSGVAGTPVVAGTSGAGNSEVAKTSDAAGNAEGSLFGNPGHEEDLD